jgi:hypothetical protein
MELPASAASTAKSLVDEDLVKLLVGAVHASERGERGFVSLSEISQLAANGSPFDARSRGVSRRSELIEVIPQFRVEKREGARFMRSGCVLAGRRLFRPPAGELAAPDRIAVGRAWRIGRLLKSALHGCLRRRSGRGPSR